MSVLTSLEAISTPTTLFNLETGKITYSFKKQLDLVGLISKQFFPKYDPYHILNVSEALQTNGCSPKDPDFYKNGGVSEFKINYEQAVSILEEMYSSRKVLWTEEMQHCGYEKALGSYAKAVIAWASSELNLQAQQVYVERGRYNATHILW